MARVFTREQFYELVWSKPMTHLAKEFAISDVALHKICKKHGIPNPPLGWWAKKAAGKKVKQIPLPEAKLGASDRITIADGDLSRESSALASAREQARIRASEGGDDQAAPPSPIVDRTLDKLRKAKPSDVGIVVADGGALIKCEVASPSIDRLAVILPRIVREASLQGFELVAVDGSVQFKSETEAIAFSVTETVRREKHVLTVAERVKEEAWQRKRDRAAGRNSWDDVFFDRRGFPIGTSIRRVNSHSSLSRFTSLEEEARPGAASAMPRSNGLRLWPVTLLWVLQCSLQRRRNNVSSARLSSEGLRRRGDDTNSRRASSASKTVEPPDWGNPGRTR